MSKITNFENFDYITLLEKRGNYTRKFDYVFKQLEFELTQCDPLLDSLKNHVADLESVMNNIFSLFDAIMTLHDKEAETSVKSDSIGEWFQNLQDKHLILRSKANAKIASFVDNAVKTENKVTPSLLTSTPTKTKKSSFLKLNKVNVPKFDGETRSFLPFKRDFLYLTSDITDEDRHLILKDCMSNGILKKRICAFSGYADAWQFLEKKFGDNNKQYKCLLDEIDKIGQFSHRGSVDHKKLDEFLQKLQEFESRFQNLGLYSEFSSKFMLSLLEKKLPEQFSIKWQEDVHRDAISHEVPSLISWLENQLEYMTIAKSNSEYNKSTPVTNVTLNSVNIDVTYCIVHKSKGHNTCECNNFLSLDTESRLKHIKDAKACFKCMKRFCNWKACIAVCSKCGGKHHELLHEDSKSSNNSNEQRSNLNTSVQEFVPKSNDNNSTISNTNSSCGALNIHSKPCLPIIRVNVSSLKGPSKKVEGILLFDTGSQITLIRRSFAEKVLGTKFNSKLIDLSLTLATSEHKSITTETCNFKVTSLDGQFSISMYNIPIISTVCADAKIIEDEFLNDYTYLSDLSLSIPHGPIDILVGTDYPMAHVDYDFRHGDSYEGPIAKLTPFGWTLIGPLLQCNTANFNNISFQLTNLNVSDELSLKEFMNNENAGLMVPDCHCLGKTSEERDVESKIRKSIKKVGNKFQISLPWKYDPSTLPNNKEIALKRFLSTERRLQSNPKMKEMYKAKIHQNIADGFVREVSKEEMFSNSSCWYLPHLPVMRDSVSTPLRVCFDAAATFKGVSLNSYLFTGPNTYGDIFEICLRFRKCKIALNADISKMFNQILLDPVDRKYHRFLWRDEITQIIKTYEWIVLTFGDTSCPSLSGMVMETNALLHKIEFPRAAESILTSFWVDDLADSVDTEDEAKQLKMDLIMVLKNGGFSITKWCSNNQNLSDHITDKTLVLGTQWLIGLDKLCLKLNTHDDKPITKRTILGTIASCYDVNGFAAAVTIKSKIFLQSLWIHGISWDTPLTSSLQSQWEIINKDLRLLKNVQFTRCILPEYTSDIEIHSFCDASENAYGAVSFIRLNAHSNKDIIVRFIASKNKVSPLKSQSIPRLELNSCVINTRLTRSILKALKIPDSVVKFWSDSSVALAWIRSESRSLKPYVRERVSNIQCEFDSAHWNYVPTEINPADNLTKGIGTERLKTWICGPDFIKNNGEIELFEEIIPSTKEINAEKVKMYITLSVTDQLVPIIDIKRFSSLKKLLNTTVLILKFIYKLKSKIKSDKNTKDYTIAAEHYWIKISQSNLNFNDKHILRLTPMKDADNIWRAGGRIDLAEAPDGLVDYDVRHPIILPKGYFSYLILKHYHTITIHGGQQKVVAESRRKYWIIGDIQTARGISFQCKSCRWLHAKPLEQIMCKLPKDRLSPMTPAFYFTIVDYMGPIRIKISRNITKKGFAALFSCLNTRAVHIELAEDLTTMAFLLSFRRFSALRGSPYKMYSDNGTNFVGASRELKSMIQGFSEDELRNTFNRDHNLIWQFSTPTSSHHNGVVERLVRNLRQHLFHVVKDSVLTHNEWATILYEATHIINSRPLYPSSSDPIDKPPITPNHLLIGRSGLTTNSGPFFDSVNPKHRFEYCEKIVNDFWHRWIKHFLPNLLPRNKWFKERKNLCEGDLVLLLDANLPRAYWKTGVVLKAFPGKDGLVRSVQVKTADSIYERPITKLTLLLTKDILANGDWN